jgi:cell division septation protein DedD
VTIAQLPFKGTASMAENRKGKDKRFYFSRGQFLLLGGGFSIASTIVFLLGMLVGQKAEKNSKAESRENRLPARQEVASVAKRAEDKPAPAASKPRPAEDDARESRRPWTVQVNAFPDEKSAKTWVDRLKDKGYNAYLSESRIQGRVWYRVRVGRFETRDEAEKTQEALKRKEHLAKAFATSR